MSLKGFHIVFITFSTLLALGCAAGCIWANLIASAPIYITGAIACFAAALGLVVYGVWFWKKMKRLRLFS